jgi:hypothetical protein
MHELRQHCRSEGLDNTSLKHGHTVDLNIWTPPSLKNGHTVDLKVWTPLPI